MTPQVVPHSITAEQAVLGALMQSDQAWETVDGLLSARDFYRADHGLVFSAVADLAAAGRPMDVITLSETLGDRGMLWECGGLAYLATVAKETPSAANIAAYAEIVREKSVLRQLIAAGQSIADLAFNPGGRSTAELLESAAGLVARVAEVYAGAGDETWKSYRAVMSEAVDSIEQSFQREGHVTGLSSGLLDLDQITGGLQRGDLVIVAGRPSMGKTTLAMQIGEHIALAEQLPVAVFSLEMPAKHLGLRSLSSHSRVPFVNLRNGKLDEQEWPRLTVALQKLSPVSIYVDDASGLSPAELRLRTRRLQRQCGPLGAVIVDYLQLMRVPGMEPLSVGETSEITRCLKALAKELDCPVIALSQLNRDLERRTNKRPMMSDLRNSGSIEQDADLIMFIYRDEVYYPDSADKGTAEIIIGKHRNGPLGTVRTAFEGEFTRFENLTHREGAHGYA